VQRTRPLFNYGSDGKLKRARRTYLTQREQSDSGKLENRNLNACASLQKE
jgi:hypothetical protein